MPRPIRAACLLPWLNGLSAAGVVALSSLWIARHGQDLAQLTMRFRANLAVVALVAAAGFGLTLFKKEWQAAVRRALIRSAASRWTLAVLVAGCAAAGGLLLVTSSLHLILGDGAGNAFRVEVTEEERAVLHDLALAPREPEVHRRFWFLRSPRSFAVTAVGPFARASGPVTVARGGSVTVTIPDALETERYVLLRVVPHDQVLDLLPPAEVNLPPLFDLVLRAGGREARYPDLRRGVVYAGAAGEELESAVASLPDEELRRGIARVLLAGSSFHQEPRREEQVAQLLAHPQFLPTEPLREGQEVEARVVCAGTDRPVARKAVALRGAVPVEDLPVRERNVEVLCGS